MKRFMIILTSFLCNLSFSGMAREMTATLTLSERVPIEQLAESVLDPESERYKQYYTPEELRELAAPSDEDYGLLIKILEEEGFKIAFESKSHLVLTIKGDHTLFEKTFNTGIEMDGNFHMTDVEPEIPSNLPMVNVISGLDKTHQFRPLYRIVTQMMTLEKADGPPGVRPEKIKEAYGFDKLYAQGLTGKDQYIAIATYKGYAIEDVREFYKLIRLSPVPTIDTVFFNGKAEYESTSATETELDAQMAGMIAPGAKILVFASAENSEDGELALFTAILDDNRAKIVNYSWGMCESSVTPSHIPAMNKVLARAVAQGVNVFVASGDTGSDTCQVGTVNADWPAVHPSIISVGGTSLYFNKDGSRRENGWSGSGGGVSASFKLPVWQSKFQAPYVKRSYPDVSFNADPSTGQGVWIRPGLKEAPEWQLVGGTSMAAPQWAGFIALVNEGRQKRGKKSIGFLNPFFYKASEADRSAIFNDIIKGKNGEYSADKGWDAVTGWGSLQAEALYNFLVSK